MRFFIVSILLISFIIVAAPLTGQVASADIADDIARREAQLRAQLQQLEGEIEDQRELVQGKQKEAVSLERDIAVLDGQIYQSQLQIRARDISINQIGSSIVSKTEKISQLGLKLNRERASLAEILRRTQENDDATLVELVLSGENLSDFFSDVDDFDSIQAAMQASFALLRTIRSDTQVEKESLEDKKVEEVDLRSIQQLQKKSLEQAEDQKEEILEVTRGEEAVYTQILESRERDAASIRAELFNLRGTAAIPFGEAVELAFAVSDKTGVRPAFLLGIIAEESNLGENIGQCNLPDDPPIYKWQSIMKDPRDTVPYLDITRRLGLDPNQMPLSCAPSYGYGGAMGPAQFIPSTWALYESRIADLTGHKPPNPWDPGDAFTASGILLSDNGAKYGDFASERLAALRYFAGWKNANKSAYSFYGDDVMNLALKFQRQIDILQGS